jgi:hypothetical protein
MRATIGRDPKRETSKPAFLTDAIVQVGNGRGFIANAADHNRHPRLMDCLPPWLWRELSQMGA